MEPGKALRKNQETDFVAAADRLLRRGRPQEAVDLCREAVQKDAQNARAWLKMGDAIQAQGNPSLLTVSLACFRKALALCPEDAHTLLRLGRILRRLGQIKEAETVWQQAARLSPERVDIRFSLLNVQCPTLYHSEAEMAARRAAYAAQLAALAEAVRLDSPSAIAHAARAVGIYPFFLGYQGCNDVDLQRRYGELVCRIQAARYPQWSRAVPPPPREPGEPLRVGIVSGFFRSHAVWKFITRGWLQALDRERFALYGYSTARRKDACTEMSRQACTRFVEDVRSLPRLCRLIQEDRPHVLLYPEIGMNRLAIRLAALRLAPVQGVSWGHSTTSGLPTMDYYLSSELMEPERAEEHYTEKLVPLAHIGTWYPAPAIGPATRTRSDLGLREDGVLYLCIQSLFKYLPSYDEVFPQIAKAVKNCQFVFLSGPRLGKGLVDMFRRRLAGAFARHGLDSEEHVVILPFLDDESYFSLHRLADVFLDSTGWSGCNTTMEALSCDLPVVTQPGAMMRGRQSLGLLRRIGVTETVASSVDAYVQIATRLGRDPGWRRQVRQAIADRKHLLYEDGSGTDQLGSFLEQAVLEAERRWNQGVS